MGIVEKKKKPEDIFTQFVEKKDDNFQPQESKDIWDYAKKEYIDKDKGFDDTIAGVATDLGLTQQQVRKAITLPKSVRKISDDLYMTMRRRTLMQNKSKEYILTANRSKLSKFIKSVPQFFMEKAILGHGTVGFFTHAGAEVLDPRMAKIFWKDFFKQYQYAFGNQAEYEMAMQDLIRHPDFAFWKRAGLKIDPENTHSDDYGALKKFFGKLALAGDRGFNALKVYRLDKAKRLWDGLSESEKADPNMAKMIAKRVNNSTGTTDDRFPDWVNNTIFAPRLLASKFNRIIAQPYKAVETLTKWDKATPAEKASAILTAKTTGVQVATLVTLLYANKGLLKLAGSDQDINFTDPQKADWLKFKAGDITLDPTGGQIPETKFIENLLQAGFEKAARKAISETQYSQIGRHIRGKLAPGTANIYDAIVHHDFMGNTLPWYNDRPDNVRAHKLSWEEYIESQFPIPIAEAFKVMNQSMLDNGMDKKNIDEQA